MNNNNKKERNKRKKMGERTTKERPWAGSERKKRWSWKMFASYVYQEIKQKKYWLILASWGWALTTIVTIQARM